MQTVGVSQDRTETLDLAAQQPARVESMKTAYASWAQATGRAMPGVESKKKKKQTED